MQDSAPQTRGSSPAEHRHGSSDSDDAGVSCRRLAAYQSRSDHSPAYQAFSFDSWEKQGLDRRVHHCCLLRGPFRPSPMWTAQANSGILLIPAVASFLVSASQSRSASLEGQSSLDSLKPGVLKQMKGVGFGAFERRRAQSRTDRNGFRPPHRDSAAGPAHSSLGCWAAKRSLFQESFFLRRCPVARTTGNLLSRFPNSLGS